MLSQNQEQRTGSSKDEAQTELPGEGRDGITNKVFNAEKRRHRAFEAMETMRLCKGLCMVPSTCVFCISFWIMFIFLCSHEAVKGPSV